MIVWVEVFDSNTMLTPFIRMSTYFTFTFTHKYNIYAITS